MILVRFARTLGLALLLTAPAFAQDAERVPVKTVLDGTMTVNGLIQITLAFAGFVTLYFAFKKHGADNARIQQEREDRMMKEISKHNDGFEGRLSGLEKSQTETRVKLEGFVPKGEIDKGFEHERNNRLLLGEATRLALSKHDDGIASVRESVAGIRVQVESAATGISDLSDRLKDMSREMAAGFDKMRDAISHVGTAR